MKLRNWLTSPFVMSADDGEPAAPAGGGLAAKLYPDGGDALGEGKPAEAAPPAADPALAPAAVVADPPKEEAKPEGSVAAPEAPKEGEEKPAESAVALKPEDYKIEVPEGATVDDTLMGEFRGVAAELGLTQENAQKLAGMYFAGMKSQVEQILTASQAEFTKTQQDWQTEIKALPEFSTPAAMKESQQTIGKLIDEFSDDPQAVRDGLNLTGAGNNPAMVRLLLKVGNALKEGAVTPQGAPLGKRGPRTLGETLYPEAKQG